MKLPEFVAVRQATPKTQSKAPGRQESHPKEAVRSEAKGTHEGSSFRSNLREEAREDRSIRREEQEKTVEREAPAKEQKKVPEAKDVVNARKLTENKKSSKNADEPENLAFDITKNAPVLKDEVEPKKLEELLGRLEELSQKEEVNLGEILSLISSVSEELKPKLAEFKEELVNANSKENTAPKDLANNLLVDLSAGYKSVKIHVVDTPAQTKVKVQLKENLFPQETQKPVSAVESQETKVSEKLNAEAKSLSDTNLNQQQATNPSVDKAKLEMVADSQSTKNPEVPKGIEVALEKAEPSKAKLQDIAERFTEDVPNQVKSKQLEQVIESSPIVENAKETPSKALANPVNVSVKLSDKMVEVPKAQPKEFVDLPKDNLNKAMPKQDLSKLQSEVKSFEFTVKKPQLQQETQSSPLKRLADATHSLQTKHSLQQEGQNLSEGEAEAEGEDFRFEKELKHSFKKLRSILHRHSDMAFGQAITTQSPKVMAKSVLPQSMARLQTQIADKLNQNLPKLAADHNMKMSLEVQNIDLGNVRITIEQSGNQLNINVQGDRALNQLLTQARNELQSQIKMDGFENLDLNMNFGDESKNEQDQQGNEDASRVTLAGEESEDVMSLFEQSSRRFFDHITENAS